MKKIMSLVLAMVMVCSLSVTAFAADQTGTTTLTANIPNAATPSYRINIPADMTLEYGNTGNQTIGDVYVTDVTGCDTVSVQIPYTDLVNKSDSTDTIPLILYARGIEMKKDGTEKNTGACPTLYNKTLAGSYGFDANGYATLSCEAMVSDWSGATAGATYKAVVTFQFFSS